MKKKLIAPSILSADFANLGREIDAVEKAGADIIHIDVMDGHFVSNITIGPPVVASIKQSTSLPLDVHLMIDKPERYISEFITVGADYISFHLEATAHAHGVVQMIKKGNVKAGVAINPATPVSMIMPLLADIDFLLVMSVNPGFGGQQFIESSCEKIKEAASLIKNCNRDILIEIDGGVKSGNIGQISRAGADMFVAGSAVFGSGDYKAAIQTMKEEIVPTKK